MKLINKSEQKKLDTQVYTLLNFIYINYKIGKATLTLLEMAIVGGQGGDWRRAKRASGILFLDLGTD